MAKAAKYKRIIVKVQTSIVTFAPHPMALVYNQSKSVYSQFPITAQLLKILKGEPKTYWYADLVPDPRKAGAFQVSIVKRAPWQEW